MNIAIVLVHNKTDSENEEQINDLIGLLQDIRENSLDENGEIKLDGQGNPVTHHVSYKIKNLDIEHEVKVYQIIPYQPDNQSDPYEAIRSSNLNSLVSHNVYYGKGDEDKVGTHPRFFNWGLKRGVDYGADMVLYLEDTKKFKVKDLKPKFNKLKNEEDLTEFIEDGSGKIVSAKCLKEVGQLDETKTIAEAIVEYKVKVTEKGYQNG